MKKLMTVIAALVLSVIMAVTNPLRIMASNAEAEIYISEIKIGMGKKYSTDPIDALKGYTIVKDANGNYVDFNDNAGGGWGSKGDKIVYIGYKTTSNRKDAITDIALMNMKGGYKTEDYDALMEKYINAQITPFVDDFMAAIREYRENYNSPYTSNRERARYINAALNKYTDDDCNDAPLGDLLLNQTKYEMGDAAYNALSDAEKAKHADLVTIIAQSNGKATLAIENLLVRASDAQETTWIERLSETTVDDLLESTGLSYTKAFRELDRLYYDDAMRLLDMWDPFKEILDKYDETKVLLEELQKKDMSEQYAIVDGMKDLLNTTEEQRSAYAKAVVETQEYSEQLTAALSDVFCKECLERIEYGDGNLLDLFTASSEEIEEDITRIYPLVASLSDGQRAGLELLTMEDLVMLGATDEKGYKDAAFEDMQTSSVYEGVDRGIYEPGGVGLTSDTLRERAMLEINEELGPKLSGLTYGFIGLTAGCAVAFGISFGVMTYYDRAVNTLLQSNRELAKCRSLYAEVDEQLRALAAEGEGASKLADKLITSLEGLNRDIASLEETVALNKPILTRMAERSSNSSGLVIGISLAMIILLTVTTYLSWRDLKNYYKVDYTPIPRYMVDEKDITAYNANGEKIVIKNQAAYYKAALCNRDTSAEYYKVAKDIADLNGDVAKQWLALYYSKNETEMPILVDSLKVVKGNDQIPAGYTTGVHMFGTEAAENFNNPLYIWNSGAESIYLYYKTEGAKDPGLAGSGFTGGAMALTTGAGLAVGGLTSAITVKALGKKKKKEEESE